MPKEDFLDGHPALEFVSYCEKNFFNAEKMRDRFSEKEYHTPHLLMGELSTPIMDLQIFIKFRKNYISIIPRSLHIIGYLGGGLPYWYNGSGGFL